MNPRELEQLEKKSIYTMRVNSDLKDQVINGYLNEMNKVVKKLSKNKRYVIFVVEEKVY